MVFSVTSTILLMLVDVCHAHSRILLWKGVLQDVVTLCSFGITGIVSDGAGPSCSMLSA
jgi:hypothetical protein